MVFVLDASKSYIKTVAEVVTDALKQQLKIACAAKVWLVSMS